MMSGVLRSVCYGYNDLTLRSVYAFFNADPTVQELGQGIVFRW